MRIISKEHDYYDSVQAYGQDRTLVYAREARDLSFSDAMACMGTSFVKTEDRQSFSIPFMRHLGHEIPKRWGLYNGWNDYRVHDLRVRRLIIGFCGQWIPCLSVEERFPEDYSNPFKQTYFPGDQEKLTELSRFFESQESVEKRVRTWSNYLSIELQDKDDLFHKVQSPILVVDVNDWGRRGFEANDVVMTADANLAEHHFYRHKDAFTAYQDISQYLSGVLGVGNPKVVEIEDKYLRDAKGFDDWSFKKRPKGIT